MGGQIQHQAAVRETLHQGLMAVPEHEQVHYIAAMANAKGMENIELFRRTIILKIST